MKPTDYKLISELTAKIAEGEILEGKYKTGVWIPLTFQELLKEMIEPQSELWQFRARPAEPAALLALLALFCCFSKTPPIRVRVLGLLGKVRFNTSKASIRFKREMRNACAINFSTEEERGQLNMFNNECEGMCGV
jgi:hypothetical protein